MVFGRRSPGCGREKYSRARSLLWISSRRAPPVERVTGYTSRCRAPLPGSCGRRAGPGGRTSAPARSAPVLAQVRQDRPRPAGRTTGPLPRAASLARVPDGAGPRGRGATGNYGRDLLLDRDPRRLTADGLSRCLGDALYSSRPHSGLASPPARRAAKPEQSGPSQPRPGTASRPWPPNRPTSPASPPRPARAGRVTQRAATPRRTAKPLTRPAREGDPGFFV